MNQNDLLKSSRFLFTLTNRNDIVLSLQSVSGGGISLGGAPYATRTHDINIAGDTIDYSGLTLTVLVRNDLTELKKLQDWIIDCANTDDAHTSLSEVGELIVLDKHNKRSGSIIFKGCWPLSMSAINMSLVSEEAVITVDLTIEYDEMTIT